MRNHFKTIFVGILMCTQLFKLESKTQNVLTKITRRLFTKIISTRPNRENV